MNDSSASATSATASSNSKKASQDAGTMLFITSPPFVDQVRLVTGLFSGKDAMDWNARRRRRTLLRAPDGGLHITPDGGTWQRHKQKKGQTLRSVPSLDARRPRYWLKEDETPGRKIG